MSLNNLLPQVVEFFILRATQVFEKLWFHFKK